MALMEEEMKLTGPVAGAEDDLNVVAAPFVPSSMQAQLTEVTAA
jgi:hypothetical protein